MGRVLSRLILRLCLKVRINLEQLHQFIHAHPELERLVQNVKTHTKQDDSAHDIAHFERVAIWTSKLVEHNTDLRLVIAAAYLHDYVNVPKNSPDRNKASELSANKARKILPNYGFSDDETATICDAILNHSFSRGTRPETHLGLALQDADRLESLGVLGIMRTISTGVRMGAQYFHPTDPFAKSRDLDDMKYSVDHFYNKLFKLPELMNTKRGREEASRRVKIMKEFLHCLEQEL